MDKLTVTGKEKRQLVVLVRFEGMDVMREGGAGDASGAEGAGVAAAAAVVTVASRTCPLDEPLPSRAHRHREPCKRRGNRYIGEQSSTRVNTGLCCGSSGGGRGGGGGRSETGCAPLSTL